MDPNYMHGHSDKSLVSTLHDVCINSLPWYGVKSIGYGLLHTSHCQIQEALLLSMYPVDMSNDKPQLFVVQRRQQKEIIAEGAGGQKACSYFFEGCDSRNPALRIERLL